MAIDINLHRENYQEKKMPEFSQEDHGSATKVRSKDFSLLWRKTMSQIDI